MKQKLAILIVTFLATLTAFAETLPGQVQKSSSTLLKDSSEQNRLGKKWTLQGQLFGAGPTGSSEKALIAGYFLNANSLMQTELGLSSVGDVAYSSPRIGLHYKRFFGNSFYAKVGVDYRYVDYQTTNGYTGGDENFQGQSLAAGLVVGNQWQWDSFTLGCDWIGYSLPFASNVIVENYASNNPLHREELQDAQKKYLENGAAQALRFYVGYTF